MKYPIAIATAVGIWAAVPALAQSAATVKQSQTAFAGCVANLHSTGKASRAIRQQGLEPMGKLQGVAIFMTADKKATVTHGKLAGGDFICSLLVKSHGLGRANATAKSYAQRLGAEKVTPEDRRASKMWHGTLGNRNLSVFTMKSASGGFFRAPSVNVMTWP